jgi:hypothetical protein
MNSSAVVATGAGFSAKSVESFFGNYGRHAEGGNGIGPPPTECEVEEKAAEENSGEIGADVGLARIGLHGSAVESGCYASLCTCKQRHNDERECSDDDAWNAVFGSVTGSKCKDGVSSDVGCESEKAEADETKRETLGAFAGEVIAFGGGTESPQHDGAGGDFDYGVESEPDQGDAAGYDSGDDGDKGLEGVPEDSEVFETASATHEDGTRDAGSNHINFESGG